MVGHLGCFHFSTPVKREAVNMAEKVSVEQDVKSFEHTPRVVYLDQMVDLFSAF